MVNIIIIGLDLIQSFIAVQWDVEIYYFFHHDSWNANNPYTFTEHVHSSPKKTIPDKISKIAKGCSFFFPADLKLRYGVGKQMTLVPHIDS